MEELFERKHIYNQQTMGHGIHTKAFTCPNCYGFSSQIWSWSLKHQSTNKNDGFDEENVVIVSKCQACKLPSVWLKNLELFENPEDNFEMLLYPRTSSLEESPNPDMPKKVKSVFNEALLVLDDSPIASAALARLAIDILTKELGATGKTLNDRIGDLVSKGLPVTIQQALDSIRVIGNNAVHPGQIDVKDNKELAVSLLKFINIIVENQISQPNLIKRAYSSLPERAKKGIENRDKQN